MALLGFLGLQRLSRHREVHHRVGAEGDLRPVGRRSLLTCRRISPQVCVAGFQGLEGIRSLLQLPGVSFSSHDTTMSLPKTFSTFCPVYSFSLFLPTIVKDLGYKNNEAQLLTIPPYVVACFFCISAGYLSDRLQTRGIIMIAFNLVAIIGLSMLVSSDNPHVKYAGTFFFASGVYQNVPQCMAWNGNNTGGSTKRSISIAMQAMTGNLIGHRLFSTSFRYIELPVC